MSEGGSSRYGAAVNLAKVSIGVGVLTLPYSVSKGGLAFAPLLIAIIAYWNAIVCSMMIICKNRCKDFLFPSGISSTYSAIAYVGAGWAGVRLTDLSVIITLIGVCVSYQITFATLVSEVELIARYISKPCITMLGGLIVFPLACAKDVGVLSVVSMGGLLCLVLGILSIIVYGVYSFGEDLADPLHSDTGESLTLWPRTMTDMTSFIGVATFCFGLASLAFPIEESMRDKNQFNTAVLYSLIFVWGIYVVVGDGASLLYINDPAGIQDNILSNLPLESIAATLVRLCMAFVCVFTYPLTVVPPAQMIERLILDMMGHDDMSSNCCLRSLWSRLNRGLYGDDRYEAIPNEESFANLDTDEKTEVEGVSEGVSLESLGSNQSSDVNGDTYELCGWGTSNAQLFCYFVRFCLVVLTTTIAAAFPYFGVVISLLGCFTVSILSFVIPPYLHLNIVTKPQLLIYQSGSYLSHSTPLSASIWPSSFSPLLQYRLDVVLVMLGIIFCLFTTSITFYDVIHKFGSGLAKF